MEPAAEQRRLEENGTSSFAALKLPDFWTSDCELWFVHIEALFRRHRVTSQATKYDNVVSALNRTPAALVRDYLQAPPPDDQYDTLKRELLRRTSDSESWRIQQLLSSEQLGDRKPTELLRRMAQLLGTGPSQQTRKSFGSSSCSVY
ncbi:uncharacterized protein [Dermacentor albipictus]|uniref:uncharacterized protein n=1 Tax=Dermacentor albipictus TaxID=60249 RepID=UPI0038FCCA9C